MVFVILLHLPEWDHWLSKGLEIKSCLLLNDALFDLLVLVVNTLELTLAREKMQRHILLRGTESGWVKPEVHLEAVPIPRGVDAALLRWLLKRGTKESLTVEATLIESCVCQGPLVLLAIERLYSISILMSYLFAFGDLYEFVEDLHVFLIDWVLLLFQEIREKESLPDSWK